MLQSEFSDALDAWRKHPLARRLIGLTTACVVGDGIRVSSDYAPLARYIERFWHDPRNNMPLRQYQWCDELARAGELFITIHTNPADGMGYVRAVSASAIDRITWQEGDYETELTYHEAVGMDDPDYAAGGRIWYSPEGERVRDEGERRKDEDGRAKAEDRRPEDETGAFAPSSFIPQPSSLPQPSPVMLHFAVNRPVGAVRGESDLAPVAAWLRRYNRWLEDRVRLNAAVRAFLWIVKVPAGRVQAAREQWRRPPEPGTVIVSEAGSEEWQAVTPGLEARDAALDGRAIRWMIAAGGLGTSLVDLGEAEDANLATATAMAEQRVRFMVARQAFFAQALGTVVLTAYNRAVAIGAVRGRPCTLADLQIACPDISPADNAEQAGSAWRMAAAFKMLRDVGADGPAYLASALRLVLRFAGESLTQEEMAQILDESLATM